MSPIEKIKYMKENPKTILLPKEKKARKQKLKELKLFNIDPSTVSDEAKGEVAQTFDPEDIPTLSGSYEKTIDPLLQNYGDGKPTDWKKKFEDHMKEMKKLEKASVRMDKKDYLAEHKRLIGLLNKMITLASKEKKTQQSEPDVKKAMTGGRLPPLPNLTLDEYYNMYGKPPVREQYPVGPEGDAKYKEVMDKIMYNYERRKLGWSPINPSAKEMDERNKRIEEDVRKRQEYSNSPQGWYEEQVKPYGNDDEVVPCSFNSDGSIPLDEFTGKPTTVDTTRLDCFYREFYNPQTGELDSKTHFKRRTDLNNAFNREVSGWEQFKRGFTGSIKKFAQPFLDVVSIVPGIGSVASALSKGIDFLPSADASYGGAKKKGLELHAVIVKKPISKEEAIKIGQSVVKSKSKKFVRETSESFRFRNIPKQKFNPKSFKTKKINPQISMVFGKLK